MSFWIWVGVIICLLYFLLFVLPDSEQERRHDYKSRREEDLRFLEEWDFLDQLEEFEDDEE